jgi:hypothetical protein
VFDLLKSVYRYAAPTLWIIGGFLAIFTLFVGVTLVVALFSHDKSQADRASKVLRELLAFLRAVLTSRPRS